ANVRPGFGNRAVSLWPEIPGFASPPRDGFAFSTFVIAETTFVSWAERSSLGPPSRYDPRVPRTDGCSGQCQDAPPASAPQAGAEFRVAGSDGVGLAGAAGTSAPPGFAGATAERIAAAITTTTPSPISTSPMLNTFAIGSQAGIAKMSV